MNTATSKKSTSFHWNSYGMMEYLLVIYPGPQVQEKILQETSDIYQQYGEKTAVCTLPHITIASFLAKEAMEETLNRWIQKICCQQECFELTLNNYSGFPPHTIYLRIQEPAAIYGFTHQLKILDDFIRSSDCPPLKASSRPNLVIASKLTLEVYNQALKAYAQKDFHESFLVEEVVLLKRSHEFDTCTKVNRFHLLSNAYNTKKLY